MPKRLKSDEVSSHAAILGRRGGEITLEKYGREHFKEISKQGVKTRKKK